MIKLLICVQRTRNPFSLMFVQAVAAFFVTYSHNRFIKVHRGIHRKLKIKDCTSVYNHPGPPCGRSVPMFLDPSYYMSNFKLCQLYTHKKKSPQIVVELVRLKTRYGGCGEVKKLQTLSRNQPKLFVHFTRNLVTTFTELPGDVDTSACRLYPTSSGHKAVLLQA